MPNQPTSSIHPKLMAWIACPSCGNLQRFRPCSSGVKIHGRDCVRWDQHHGPCTDIMVCHHCPCSYCGGDTWIEKEAAWPLPPLLVGCRACNPEGVDDDGADDPSV